ncbi:MAG: monovalent cation/H(+) antiporter subunit G [Nitrospirae bacterium]|jgi:multicomponent Na+:H+ antiporter subunit G|nr:monovalent cation/H(+) antiporter subunit G [Nitrospirota bacterium]
MALVAVVLISIGVFFMFAGTIGFLRLPDFYTRMHSTGKSDTLGMVLAFTGLALYNLDHGLTLSSFLVSLKIMFIAIFWFVGSPTVTHTITRAAFKSKIAPWTKDGRHVIDWPPDKGGSK